MEYDFLQEEERKKEKRTNEDTIRNWLIHFRKDQKTQNVKKDFYFNKCPTKQAEIRRSH